jgi:hypothetical protein
VKKSARKALLDEAGLLYGLQKELASLQAERSKLDDRIRQVERRLAEAKTRYDARYDQLVATAGTPTPATQQDEQPLTPGKLPHRVLAHMRASPARIHTAAELQVALAVRDIQQVRTALARLVDKGLVRRMGVKGEFTI